MTQKMFRNMKVKHVMLYDKNNSNNKKNDALKYEKVYSKTKQLNSFKSERCFKGYSRKKKWE